MPKTLEDIPAIRDDFVTVGRRTGLRSALLSEGTVADPVGGGEVEVSHVVLHGVSFRSSQPLAPGSVLLLRAGGSDARLSSSVRIVACRLRSDGTHDVKAEFF
jgi:hypothetical protein